MLTCNYLISKSTSPYNEMFLQAIIDVLKPVKRYKKIDFNASIRDILKSNYVHII